MQFKLLRSTKFLLIVILSLGFLLRILPAITNNFPYTYDVGRDLLNLKEIIDTHHLPLIGPTTGLHGLFYGPWWYYILIPAFILSAGNPQGLVVFMAITGVLTIYFGYLIGRKASSEILGLIFAALISFSPLLISLSSQIWNPNIAPLWLIILIYILLVIKIDSKIPKVEVRSIIWKKNPFLFFLLGLFLGLSIEAEVVYGLLLFVAIILTSVFLVISKANIKYIFFSVLGFITILLPRVAFELKHNFIMTKTLLGFAGGDSSNSFSLNIGGNIINRLHFLLDLWTSTFNFGNIYIGVIFLLICIVAFIALRRNFNKNESFIAKLCILVMAIYYIGLVFFQQDIWGHYVVGLPIVLVVFVGLILRLIFAKFSKTTSLFIISILLIVMINPVSFFTSDNGKNDVARYKNQRQVVDYIYKDANNKSFKYIAYTPPLHDYTYKYIFEWYGAKKYGYLPEIQNKRFYLIIEPDYENPQRVVDWLKVRENDGVLIKEKNFDSGLRVQLRQVKNFADPK